MQLPAIFLQRMERMLGDAYAQFCAAYENPLRRGVRVNTLKSKPETVANGFDTSLTASPFANNSFYLDAEHKAGADPLFHAGAYYMQEPSAASAVTVLSPQKGERILDMCAAPGGKSTQIAAALDGEGLLWSNEYVRNRVRPLQQNLERCGVRNAVVSNADSAVLAQGLIGFFDRVLVDAPCSGEGMFRKEPAALEGWSEEAVRMCAQRQREILSNAAQTVKENGVLVYSTCTFAVEENESTVMWFLNTHPDFEPLEIDVSFGMQGLSAQTVASLDPTAECARYNPKATRRIFPHHGGEGHFIAAFRRCTAPDGVTLPYAYPQDTKLRAQAEALYADCFTDEMYGIPVLLGDTIRLLPQGLPRLDGLGVVAAGVSLATVQKGRLEPTHSIFAAAHPNTCRRLLSLDSHDAAARAFLHGEELEFAGDKGYTAVAVGGAVCGFGKVSGGRLKNHYPKGLRLL